MRMSFESNAGTYKVRPNSFRCSIENCKSKAATGKQIYPIPNGATRCLWLDVIRRHNQDPNLAIIGFVCADHFSDDQKLPNGHLKGNAIPNIFPSSSGRIDSSPISCQFCNEVCYTRKDLLAHDKAKHEKELGEIRIKVLETAPEVPKKTSPCANCVGLEQIRQGLHRRRANIKQAINDLKTLRESCNQPLKLDVDISNLPQIKVDN